MVIEYTCEVVAMDVQKDYQRQIRQMQRTWAELCRGIHARTDLKRSTIDPRTISRGRSGSDFTPVSEVE